MPSSKFSWWTQLTLRTNFDKVRNFQALTLMPMVGFQIDKFHIGATYNVDLNQLVRYNYGSLEVMLGYTLCYTERFCR
jgi:hypothetical protein